MKKTAQKPLIAKPAKGVFCDADNDDLRAIKAIRSGDSRAFAQIIKKYNYYLFSKILQKVRSKETAQDILQEVYIKAYLGIDTYKKQFTFNAWITRVAQNCIIDYYRKHKNDINAQMISLDKPVITSNDSSLQMEAEDKSIRFEEGDYEQLLIQDFNRVMNLLDNKLNKEEVSILRKFYLEDKLYREIAQELGLNFNSVRVKIHRLIHKGKLKELMLENNISLSYTPV